MNNYELAVEHLALSVPFTSHESREQAFAGLKNDGLSISEAIKAVRQVAHISLGEAKELVSASIAWRPTALHAKPLHEEGMSVIHEVALGRRI